MELWIGRENPKEEVTTRDLASALGGEEEKMNMNFVVSSNVESVGWEKGFLKLKFKNGSYFVYENVPQSEYELLKKAPSVGSFINRKIINKYKRICLCGNLEKRRNYGENI